MLDAEAIFAEAENREFKIHNNFNAGTLHQTILDESQSNELHQHQACVDPTVPITIKPESKTGLREKNVVLQKLLRRWRYFDYRDGSSFVKDHAVNLPSRKRTPCYVCGQFQHIGKKCPKRRSCSTCKKRGHIAHDCPMNNKECFICLRCGESGHELFSCNVEYSPDDLKNLQCYVCKELGHLCCDNHTDISPEKSSCYNCGESGHSGLQCTKPHLDKCGSRPPSICYKCGEDDHVARKCTKDPRLPSRHKHQQVRSLAKKLHKQFQCSISESPSPQKKGKEKRTREEASELNLGAEAGVFGEYGNRRPARRRGYRHGKVKKQKIAGLLEYMTV